MEATLRRVTGRRASATIGRGDRFGGGAMVKETSQELLAEIAAGLQSGDGEVYQWLSGQLQECGASEMAVELAMGVIGQLLPERARSEIGVACEHIRRWSH